MKTKKKVSAPLPITLVIVSFLCPTELSLYLEGLRLPPHRVALILLLPMALMRLASQNRMKFRLFDLVFVAYAAWTVYVFAGHTEGREGFVYGGSMALEALGGYLVARAFIRNIDEFRASLRVIGIAIAVAALIALPETLLGQIWTHDILRSLTGYVHPTATETRLGLTRAYGVFDHPIHYGTFCAGLLALFWFAEKKTSSRRNRGLLLTGATFLGISSAPLLCLGLQVGMLVWEKLTRGVASRVGITLAILTGLYIGASAVSTRSPIAFIATGMTLDSWTGFYRLQIWEHGLNNVWANPMYGIGLADWERPWWMISATVDAFWLVITMRTGIPAFLVLVLAIVLLARNVAKNGGRMQDRDARHLAMGWMMSLIALSLIGCTVHYWNVLHAYFFFFLGLGGWLADPLKARSRAKTKRGAAPRVAGSSLAPAPAPLRPAPAQPAAEPIGDLPGSALPAPA